MEATETKSANDIFVKDFSQIFVWPLILSKKPPEKWLDEITETFSQATWQRIDNPLELLPDKLDAAGKPVLGAYEEAVYFHDFVRKFLYRADDESDQRLFVRQDIKNLTVVIDGVERSFNIGLCALNVFALGLAILTLELRYKADEANKLTLAQVQTLIDRLRRTYVPFWNENGTPGLCLDAVKLNGVEIELAELATRDTAAAEMQKTLYEPLFPWWTKILAPLLVEGTPESASPAAIGKPRFRQVLDERIPVMTTLSLTNGVGSASDLEAVSDGDWFRLAGADSQGNDTYPYNPDFLETLRAGYFYDRFMASPQSERSGATRFLFAGYHFAAVGTGWFFDNRITEHMRRHYRQMYFIVQLEFAALLMISSRLSEAAKQKNEEAKFRRRIIEIEKDFLDFTHRYRFTGVSNQLQARELFEKLRKSIELDQLYDDVQAELHQARELALALDQREESQAASNLTEVATLGIVLGLVVGVMGMNVLVGEPLADWVRCHFNLRGVGLDFSLLQTGAVLLVTAVSARLFVGPRSSRRLSNGLKLLVVLGLIGMVFGGASLYCDQRSDDRACFDPPPPIQETQQPVALEVK